MLPTVLVILHASHPNECLWSGRTWTATYCLSAAGSDETVSNAYRHERQQNNTAEAKQARERTEFRRNAIHYNTICSSMSNERLCIHHKSKRASRQTAFS